MFNDLTLTVDLNFLYECSWNIVELKDIQKELKPILIDMEDEILMEAFNITFINDFKLTKVSSNYFQLDWVEYEESLGYRALEPGKYTGESLIEFMLTGFEAPRNICLTFNTILSFSNSSPRKVVFPYQKDQYLLCKYT